MPGDTFLSIPHFTGSLMNTLDLSPCRRRTKPPPDVLLSPAPRQNQPSQAPGAVLCPSSWHTPLPRSRRCCGEPWAAPEFPFIPSLLPHLPLGLCHPGPGNRDAANATSLSWDVPAEDPGDGAGCYYRGGDRHLCETAQVAMVTGGNLGYGLPRASGTRSRASRGIRGHLRRREPGWRPPEPPEPPNCSRKLLQTWQAGVAAGSSPGDGIGLGQSSLL